MTDWVEIHTLLREVEHAQSSHFFAFNEIKNILLDQKSFSSIEELLRQLLQHLNPGQKEEIVPFLVTTSSARLNRFALYEFSAFLTPKALASINTKLFDALHEIPCDTFEALREHGVVLDVNVARALALLNTKQYMKLMCITPEIKRLKPQEKELLIAQFEEEIPKQTKHLYHDIELHDFDVQTLIQSIQKEAV